MLKHFLCVLTVFILLSPFGYASGVHEDHPYGFDITKHRYKLSNVYQINSHRKDTYPGSVKKSAFRIRHNYDLSDKNGWQATGITRVLSLGALYPWATDIDIYDTRGVQIALVDGSLATLEAAKFHLYDYDDAGDVKEVGLAYASDDFHHFAIVSSMDDPHPIAELNRHQKSWHVSVHYPAQIDDRIIRIFAAFVLDYQDKFLSSV